MGEQACVRALAAVDQVTEGLAAVADPSRTLERVENDEGRPLEGV